MEHPLIGAWTLALEGGRRPGPDLATAAFHHDGAMTITIAGYTAHGAWVAIDAGSARFRALAPVAPGEAQSGWHTLAFETRMLDDDRIGLDGAYERPTPSGTPVVTALSGVGDRMKADA